MAITIELMPLTFSDRKHIEKCKNMCAVNAPRKQYADTLILELLVHEYTYKYIEY